MPRTFARWTRRCCASSGTCCRRGSSKGTAAGSSKESCMGKIAIEAVRCKGCGRCITACPKDLIGFSNELNDRGYRYVTFTGRQDDCSGCTICAVVCPDQGIEV